jgi:dolichol-phosphate mannosyltransferase
VKKVSIVVPTYKEADNIPVLVERIEKSFFRSSYSYEIIFVDDNSDDGSKETVDMLSKLYPVQIHVRENVRGLSSAVLKGFQLATGDVYICMDADLSHPPEKAVQMCDVIFQNDADFVVGSRNLPGGSADSFSLYRRLNAFVSRVLALPLKKISDPMAGFFAFPAKLYTSDLVERLNPVGWKIGLEILVKMNPEKVIELPIVFADRMYGESKLTLREQWNYLLHLKRLYCYKYKVLARFLVFGAVGATGVIVDIGIQILLIRFFDLQFVYARIASILCAMSSNYMLNRFITFEERPPQRLITAYFSFVAICSVGALGNWLLSVYLVSTAGFHYIPATLCGILVGMVFNFVGSSVFVFKNDKLKQKQHKEKEKTTEVNTVDEIL